MIRRSTWILLAAFALVLGGAIIWTRLGPAAGSAAVGATPTLEPLWSVTATDIVGLRLENMKTAEVVEVRRGDERTPWRMIKPEEGPADAARVEWAITALVSPRPQATLPMPDDLAPFGLATPSVRVTVFMAGNVTRSFDIGRVSPAGGVFYVTVPGRGEIVMLNQYSLSDVLSLLDKLPYAPTATPGEPTSPPPTGTPVPSGS
jgi:Domain of unknown function (DUF4340)